MEARIVEGCDDGVRAIAGDGEGDWARSLEWVVVVMMLQRGHRGAGLSWAPGEDVV